MSTVSAAWTVPSIAVAMTPWAGICPRARKGAIGVLRGLRPLLPNALGGARGQSLPTRSMRKFWEPVD